MLVLDASFFGKHRSTLEDIDFAASAGTEREVRVVVPRVVVDGLDRLEESCDKHVRWRAGYGLAVLGRIPRGHDHDPLAATYARCIDGQRPEAADRGGRGAAGPGRAGG